MGKEHLFKGDLKLTCLSYFSESNSWNFVFEEKVNIQVECLWRLLAKGRIRYTSNDHGQMYGHEKPYNLEENILKLLQNTSLLEINRNSLTGDLYLEFEDEYSFEILIDSSGFEGWQLQIDSRRIIGIGQGEVYKFQ